MQVSLETTTGLERKLTIGVPANQVDDASLKKMQEMTKTQRINGFRPGKVPLNEIKKRYGKHVREEVASEVMQRSFYEAIMQEKLQPVNQPQIEPVSMEEGKDLEFTATFEVQPQVELQDLTQISVDKIVTTVTDNDLNAMIDKLSEQQGEWTEVKSKAKNGDQLIIDFVGSIDNEEFAGGKAEDFALQLGQGQMIPGFEEQLLNTKAGDDVELKVTFPEDYQSKELAGKEAVFATKVKLVNQKEVLEPAKLAEKLGIKDANVEKMHENIRENMEKESTQAINNKFKEQIMEKLAELHEFDLPNSMIIQEISSLKAQAMQQFGGQGGNPDDLPSELFTERANNRVKLGLLLSEIIQQEKMTADDNKVKAKLESLAVGSDNPQELVNYFMSDENRLNQIEQMVLEESVIEFVEQKATISEKKLSFDELMNPKAENTK